ncbi:MAG: enoyl-CoA hydratase/isomerase family protein [Bryobacteraceae bacterium]
MQLIVERKRRILRLTLNRPEKRNALTTGMCQAIVDAVESAQSDDELASILLIANGHVFCSGMDLDEASEIDSEKLDEVHERLFTLGVTSRKPIVIGVNGAALGGGLGLVAQGHVVTASSGAVFGLPEIRIGLWPFLIYRAVEGAIGARLTLELSLTGRLFHVHEAMSWGLVQTVAAAGEVLDRAKGIATDLAKTSPAALRAGMQYVQQARGLDADSAGKLSKELRNRLMETDDFREGYAAFKEKREPQWPSMPNGFYNYPERSPKPHRAEEDLGTGK